MSTARGPHEVPEDELHRFGDLGREMSGLTVLMHARIAERIGVSATDYKCLDIALRADGPLTAGQIARISGLSTGAVTGVIDRLEQHGLVRRVRDPLDRRKVLVDASTLDDRKYAHLFEHLADGLHDVLTRFDPAERAVVERFQRELNDTLQALAVDSNETGN